MLEPTLPHVFDWALRAALVGAGAWTLVTVHRLRRISPDEVERFVNRRLMELLPLPHLGDRGALLAMLGQFVPLRSLALYAVGDPTVLVARRNGTDAPDSADARFVEIHRHRLALGAVVTDLRCGTLIPALTRSGQLRGVVIISGQERVGLDDDTRATLRHIAGVLDCVSDPREPLDLAHEILALRRNGAKRLHVVRTAGRE